MKNSGIKNGLIIGIIIVLVALTRLVDHSYNFTPISALILFSVAFIENRTLKFVIPFAVIVFSDLLLQLKTGQGFHQGTATVYLGYAFVFFIGFSLLKTINVLRVIISTMAASIVFFLVTNFAFFYPKVAISNPSLGQYSHDLNGIIASYKAGIPFFRNMVFGDMFFTSTMFGVYGLYKALKLKLKKQKA